MQVTHHVRAYCVLPFTLICISMTSTNAKQIRFRMSGEASGPTIIPLAVVAGNVVIFVGPNVCTNAYPLMRKLILIALVEAMLM